MKFFSGFSLHGEQELFDFWLKGCSNYCVAGFSYGAIEALEYLLNTKSRVDKLILLSPAFFNGESSSFKKMQLQYFKRDSNTYINNFLNNCVGSSNINLDKYIKVGTKEQLEKLLYYSWDINKLKLIIEKGTTIEVILAQDDKIINSNEALSFFKDLTTTYYIKGSNHILCNLDIKDTE